MSFANMFSHVTEDQEKQIQQEFIMDITLAIFTTAILYMIMYYDPKGCGIPLREWLIGFFLLYFSRSSF